MKNNLLIIKNNDIKKTNIIRGGITVMRRAVWLVSFLFIVLALSFSDPLTGFLGIPFGSTKDQVISAMSARTTIKPLIWNDLIAYKNIRFSGRDAEAIFFYFYQDYFCASIVTIVPERNRALETYYAIKKDYYTKYGTPHWDREEYSSPYEKGDGYEETALFANKAKISASWDFDENNAILIQLEYNNKEARCEINISYFEYKTSNKKQSVERANNLDDL
jgi:hypothetical protein